MKAEEIYRAMQVEFVKLTGLKNGDRAKITREWKKGEMGFTRDMHHNMVGEIFEVVGFSGNNDCVVLSGVNAPYYVLEIVEIPKEVSLDGGERIVERLSDGIKCGCCKMTVQEAKIVIQQYKALENSFGKYSFNITVEGTPIYPTDVDEISKLL